MVLQQLLEAAGLRTRSYSGRGMYGATCLAVELPRSEGIGALLVAIAEGVDDDNRDEVAEAVRRVRLDGMGLGTVAYFPGVDFDGTAHSDDDEDAEDEDDDAWAAAWRAQR